MLQWFDTFLGLVVVLLAVSLIVMLLTQIIGGLLNLRGTNLQKGIKILLKNSSVKFTDEELEDISRKALQHSLISDSWLGSGRLKLASTIRAEELKNILRHISDDEDNDWMEKLGSAVEDIENKIDLWFDKTMDRVTQNFVTQTRVWTIIFSIIIALSLHLDVFRIFEQISSDSELRAGLIASSNALLTQAEEALGSSSPIPKVFSASISDLKARDPIAGNLPDHPESFRDQKEGADWLVSELNGHAKTDSLVGVYENIVYSKFSGSLENLLNRAGTIERKLENSKFNLIPDPYPGWNYSLFERHLWGVLAVAGLVSLGAPFWFNALKTLSSLRPILATKEEEEREQRG